jgi:hypothetical protein
MKKSKLDLSKAIRAEQSSRTTFKLNLNARDTLDELCKSFHLSPKQILNVFFDDKFLIDRTLKEVKNTKKNAETKYIRKTIVISKHMHIILNKITRDHKISRDDYMNSLIISVKNLLDNHIKEEKELIKKAKIIISDFSDQLLKVENNLKSLLPDSHPIISRFGYISVLTYNLIGAIDEKLENNIAIDPDDYSQSC